jgi:hypothetical protein
MSLWNVLVALPLSLREAVVDTYSGFRISVAGPAHNGNGLGYLESLQVSLLAYTIHGSSTWLLRMLHLPRFSEELALILFVMLLVYPAIAAIAVHVPFLGFRISVVPNAPTVAQP